MLPSCGAFGLYLCFLLKSVPLLAPFSAHDARLFLHSHSQRCQKMGLQSPSLPPLERKRSCGPQLAGRSRSCTTFNHAVIAGVSSCISTANPQLSITIDIHSIQLVEQAFFAEKFRSQPSGSIPPQDSEKDAPSHAILDLVHHPQSLCEHWCPSYTLEYAWL